MCRAEQQDRPFVGESGAGCPTSAMPSRLVRRKPHAVDARAIDEGPQVAPDGVGEAFHSSGGRADHTARSDRSVRLMLLHGADDAFCNGNDLQDFLAIRRTTTRVPAAVFCGSSAELLAVATAAAEKLARPTSVVPVRGSRTASRSSPRSCTRSASAAGFPTAPSHADRLARWWARQAGNKYS